MDNELADIKPKIEPNTEEYRYNEVKFTSELITIKTEPIDYEEYPEQKTSDDEAGTNHHLVESLTVKVEPIFYESENEEKVVENQPTTDEETEDEGKDDSDEDYDPENERKLNNGRQCITYLKSNKDKVFYSEHILSRIEIVTISEADRQTEHRQLLHSRRHMRYKCEDCALGFVVEDAYMMHMKIHSPESGNFECNLCTSRVKTSEILYRHKLRHYRRYRCTLCRLQHKEKEAAACHVMRDHDGQAFNCSFCGKGFKRPAYLKRHIEQLHTKPNTFECPTCQRVFHEKSWYRCHIRTHNAEVRSRPIGTTVICDLCAREFKNKSALRRHMATHDSSLDARIECPLCLHLCKNKDTLRVHCKRRHTDEKPVQAACPHCLRVCVSQALLAHHIRRMHTDRTKKFQCEHCKRFYLTKGEVRSHIAWSHMRVVGSGHACPHPKCARVFRTPALLRNHAARHHMNMEPQRIHACVDCGKAFADKQVLTRHMKTHSNEKYPCNECGLLFKTQSYVKVHYKLKHLNMTRAEVKAQTKRTLHVVGDAAKRARAKAAAPTQFVNVDSNVTIKIERDVDDDAVDTSQTLVDIKREQ